MKLFVSLLYCAVVPLHTHTAKPVRLCTFVSRDEAICIWEPRIGRARDGGAVSMLIVLRTHSSDCTQYTHSSLFKACKVVELGVPQIQQGSPP